MTEMYDQWLIERDGTADLRSSYVGQLRPPLAVRLNPDGSERQTRAVRVIDDISGGARPAGGGSTMRRSVMRAIYRYRKRRAEGSATVLPISSIVNN